MHEEVARTYSLNFIIKTFTKDHLTQKDVKHILNASKMVDVVVMGPGLGNEGETIKAVKSLLSKLEKPTVVDASALVYTNSLPKVTVLTPHRGEFTNLTGDNPTPENVQKWARNLGATIVCKGPEDIIADKDELIINNTGNPMMTVGGTGDVLSGFIGGLMAQGNSPIQACQIAANTLGLAAEELAHNQNSIRAEQLAEMLPHLLNKHN